MNKLLIVSLIAVAITSAACSKTEDQKIKNTLPPVIEESEAFLIETRSTLPLNFSEITPTEVKWIVSDKGYVLNGQQISIRQINNQKQQSIADFIKNNAFETNAYNTTAGTVVWQTGYQRGDIVCLLQSTVNEIDSSYDVDLSCAVYKQLIGGDKDEGGCLIAAGYSWCEAKQKCLRTWEEECTQ